MRLLFGGHERLIQLSIFYSILFLSPKAGITQLPQKVKKSTDGFSIRTILSETNLKTSREVR